MTSHVLLRDAEKEERKQKLRSSRAYVAPAEPGGTDPTIPLGYRLTDQGLFWSDPTDDPDLPAMLVASAFDVVAETRDGDGTSWGVLLRWKDHDGRNHQYALPRASLAGDGAEARRILLDGGLFIAPSRKARDLLNSFLLLVRSPTRCRATPHVGWHGNSFVLPDACFAAADREVLLLQNASVLEHCFRQSGTLESWRQGIACYAGGNSRLVLAISAAFAGPLIGPCSAEGGGIHFKGPSSIGKSTALHVAGSVWGGGDANGYVRSWRATANGIEGVAALHCDTLLCLDELSQLAPKEGGEVAYMLANGAGKMRSARDGSARRAAKWRTIFLSSGEIGLADKVAEDGRGRKLTAGQQVRVVDVPADPGVGIGMFENLHSFPSGDAFARHLRHATKQHYGVAAREYLRAIVSDIDEVKRQIVPIMNAFTEQFVPVGADGQVERVAQRFALIAVGGELAQQYGIVPWQSGEAVAAAGKCFNDWLHARGGHDAAEVRDGIEQVRSFLLAHGTSRFIPAWEGAQSVPARDVAGFRKQVAEEWDYYVTTAAWKEVCAGLDPQRTATILKLKGYLVGGDGAHLAESVRVPGNGKRRLYHIRATFLEGANET
jgi:putative DNA primase/helicase